MKTTQIEIPTYEPDSEVEYDYTRAHTLTLLAAGGLRIVMGDPEDDRAPDVLIERARDAWRVFVHPNPGDPLCIIEFREERVTIGDDSGNTLLERLLP